MKTFLVMVGSLVVGVCVGMNSMIFCPYLSKFTQDKCCAPAMACPVKKCVCEKCVCCEACPGKCCQTKK